MHPMERLRYVARASGADSRSLVRETAGSLVSVAGDPAELVAACRRIVAHHPTTGPLWWLCSRMATATDPRHEAWAAAEELAADTTERELRHAIPEGATVCVLGWPELVADVLPARGDVEVLVVDVHGEGSGLVRRLDRSDVVAEDVPVAGLGAAAAAADLLLLEAAVAGPDAFVSLAGSRAAAAVAGHAGQQVWLVAGIGRFMPQRTWDVITDRLASDEPWEEDDEIVPLDLVGRVVGPAGPESVAAALARTDTPVAPELFREGVL